MGFLYPCVFLLILYAALGSIVLDSQITSLINPSKTHIAFLVDGSTITSSEDWNSMKTTLSKIFEEATTDNVLGSVMVFSSNVNVVFNLWPMLSNKNKILTALTTLQHPQQKQDLAGALQHAELLMKQTPPDTKQVLVVFIKSQAQGFFGSSTPDTSALREKCHIFSVGFGNGIAFGLLNAISTKDSVVETSTLGKFIEGLHSNSVAFAKSIAILATITNTETLQFHSNLDLEVELLNTHHSITIPAGCVMEFSDAKATHFVSHNKKFDYSINAGSNNKFSVSLRTKPHVGARTLPEHILYSLKCSTMQLYGFFALKSHFFVADLIRGFKSQRHTINLLLIGPYGSGKTTLQNLMITAVTSLPTRIPAGVEGSGGWSTTNFTEIRDARQYYTSLPEYNKLKDFQLQIVDTQGISYTNFDNNFIEYLLEGAVADGTVGASGRLDYAKVLLNRDDGEILPLSAHVVVVVINQKFANLPVDDPKASKLRSIVNIARMKAHSPLLVVTHMDKIPKEAWQDELSKAEYLLGLGKGVALPFYVSNTTTQREFESDMQTIHILDRALFHAQTWLDTKYKIYESIINEKLKDEL